VVEDDPADPDPETGPQRRCIVTGGVHSAEEMIRCVIGPENQVVPDVERRLPGRGLWLSADRDVIHTAVAKGFFSRAARRKVQVSADLADRIESLLLRRCIDLVGLARRANQAVAGYEKVRAALKAQSKGVLLAASDGARDGRAKLRALAPALPLVTVLRGEELGAAFGRGHAVHGLLVPGRLAERLRIEAKRLAGLRPAVGDG
jgi:predicted RNA-binding protein YlxR (DUF448 family)